MFTVRFDEALKFASGLHCTQLRKGTEIPYISHLLAVTALVIEDGGSEDEAIAALLHDAIEDQGDNFPGGRSALRRLIAANFGGVVLNIVNACTDDDEVPPEEKKDPARWRARKQAYLDHIPQMSPAARRVSCADKLHNARSVLTDYRERGEAVWSRFRTKSGSDQLWYYRELVRAFKEGTGRLARELERMVDELERERGAKGTDIL